MNPEQYSNRQADTTRGTDVVAAESDVRVPVREEELVADTQLQEEGRVHLHKDVVEEQQTMNVPTRHERVRLERAPFSRVDGDASEAFQGADIDIPLMGEQPVASKQVRGVEEVRLHKDLVTEDQPVQGTVRREQIIVDDDGVDGTAATVTAQDTSNAYAASGTGLVEGTKGPAQTAEDSLDDGEAVDDSTDESLGAKIRRGVDKVIHH